MRIAVIDMGTNTFHLLIAAVDGTSFSVLHKERVAVKIGEKGINDGWITVDAQKRALITLQNFRATIDTFDVKEIYATATSAVRNAANGQDMVAMIKDTTGIDVRIITGVEEALFIYNGVRKAVKLGNEPVLIMDIGGGSIEFIIASEGEILWLDSFEIGGQRLVERFQHHDPIIEHEIETLNGYFRLQLEKLRLACEQFKPRVLVGCSGTFDTLSDIYRIENGLERDLGETQLPITLEAFHKIHNMLIVKDRSERLEIPGMIEMRVDLIVVASILIRYVLEAYAIQDLKISAYALKEGVLLSILEAVKQTEKSPSEKKAKP
jgi:exopolyphosphatase / guanosine-5'-triphosphate,3'-diphosphate pyrophosphatase